MRNLYQEVTDRIVVELEAGAAPWIYDWLGDHDLLIIKADRLPSLVALPMKPATEIAALAERAKNEHRNSLHTQGSPPDVIPANKGNSAMSDDVVRIEDGFDGYEDGVEGEDQPQAGSLTRGQPRVKFTNEADYVTDGGKELSPHTEYIVPDRTARSSCGRGRDTG
jgi:hypothetical protein